MLHVHRANPASLRVVAGEHSLIAVSGLEQISNVTFITMHEAYDFLTYENDISLIFVSSTVYLNTSHSKESETSIY